MLIRQRDLKLVSNAKEILSETVTLQHHPLIMDFKLDITNDKRHQVTNLKRI